ncbi:hypothetical protein PBY51_025013 [Eleginops maclovinus]|uniref:Uncharacterized protein n=1 Tax=Eleginops maclovinus TaxID=56733 RepID=A0AAN8AWD9_ELEMC|nr:hypothetical protein PBY51_025013 [Eleginops maclovinus]
MHCSAALAVTWLSHSSQYIFWSATSASISTEPLSSSFCCCVKASEHGATSSPPSLRKRERRRPPRESVYPHCP